MKMLACIIHQKKRENKNRINGQNFFLPNNYCENIIFNLDVKFPISENLKFPPLHLQNIFIGL